MIKKYFILLPVMGSCNGLASVNNMMKNESTAIDSNQKISPVTDNVQGSAQEQDRSKKLPVGLKFLSLLEEYLKENLTKNDTSYAKQILFLKDSLEKHLNNVTFPASDHLQYEIDAPAFTYVKELCENKEMPSTDGAKIREKNFYIKLQEKLVTPIATAYYAAYYLDCFAIFQDFLKFIKSEGIRVSIKNSHLYEDEDKDEYEDENNDKCYDLLDDILTNKDSRYTELFMNHNESYVENININKTLSCCPPENTAILGLLIDKGGQLKSVPDIINRVSWTQSYNRFLPGLIYVYQHGGIDPKVLKQRGTACLESDKANEEDSLPPRSKFGISAIFAQALYSWTRIVRNLGKSELPIQNESKTLKDLEYFIEILIKETVPIVSDKDPENNFILGILSGYLDCTCFRDYRIERIRDFRPSQFPKQIEHVNRLIKILSKHRDFRCLIDKPYHNVNDIKSYNVNMIEWAEKHLSTETAELLESCKHKTQPL